MHTDIELGPTFFGSIRGDLLAPLLLRMAMSETSSSSKAVLRSIYALSSVHLRRDTQAFAHQAKALSLLSTSLDETRPAAAAFQNIAASMLLLTCELSNVSNSKVWSIHLCGAKQMIAHHLQGRIMDDELYSVIKDWVFYHEVFTRFALVHCVGQCKWKPSCFDLPISGSIVIASEVPKVSGTQSTSPLPLTRLQNDVSQVGYSREILDCVLAITSLVYDIQVFPLESSLRSRRIMEIERQLHLRRGHSASSKSEQAEVVRLFRIAAIIYLNRIAQGASSAVLSTFHTTAVHDGLALLESIDVGKVPWPLFVIGCEASTDVRRERILQRMDAASTESKVSTPRALIEAFWVQDDLDTTQELTYLKKLSGIIMMVPTLPSFV
jgi:hypothetical protein